MEVYEILTIAIVGSMAVILVLRAIVSMQAHLTPIHRRFLVHVAYPRIFATKYKTVLNPTRLLALFYIAHFAIAIFCNAYKVQSLAAAGVRAGQLAVGYVVPLIAIYQVHWSASLLGFRLDTFKTFHKLLGTMAALQATVHSIVALQAANWTKTDTVYGFICFVSIACLAILPCARRFAYELFLRTHLLLTVALTAVLWKHLQSKSRLSQIIVAAGSVCMALSTALQWMLQALVNLKITMTGSRTTRVGETRYYAGMTLLRLDLARPLSFQPGQYILLTLLTLRHGSMWQRHPLTVVWWQKVIDKRIPQAVWVAVHEKQGWTSQLAKDHALLVQCSAWLQGPYGCPPDLSAYGNVLMFASGDDGIVVQLPLLKGLIERHASNNVKTRKVKVVWQIKHWSNMLGDWLTELLEHSSEVNGEVNKDLLEISLHHSDKLELPETCKRMIKDYKSVTTSKRRDDVAELGQRVRFVKNAPDVNQYLRQSLALGSNKSAIIISAHHALREAVRLELLALEVLNVDFIPLEYQPQVRYPREGGTAV